MFRHLERCPQSVWFRFWNRLWLLHNKLDALRNNAKKVLRFYWQVRHLVTRQEFTTSQILSCARHLTFWPISKWNQMEENSVPIVTMTISSNFKWARFLAQENGNNDTWRSFDNITRLTIQCLVQITKSFIFGTSSIIVNNQVQLSNFAWSWPIRPYQLSFWLGFE